jgi:hypothetical protein
MNRREATPPTFKVGSNPARAGRAMAAEGAIVALARCVNTAALVGICLSGLAVRASSPGSVSRVG